MCHLQMKTLYSILLSAVLLLGASALFGQEYTGHLYWNKSLPEHTATGLHAARKTTAVTHPLTLPFFEDFTGYYLYPDSNKWADYEVYINNTMCVSPISRGVATFDALDAHGIPYDSFSNYIVRYTDSLTSQPINMDLGLVTPADSVYLSFFYQPQGNGFYPTFTDSLMLYLRTQYGGFVKVWSVSGTTVQPFQQVMIPIADSFYFDSFFQFRFVSKASLNFADAIWNVDYIRLNSGRSQFDTALNDVGYTSDPTPLLNDYTSMPYRQFYADPVGEMASQFRDSIRNNGTSAPVINQVFRAKAINTGTVLQSPIISTQTIFPETNVSMEVAAYTSSIPISSIDPFDKVVFENKFYIESPTGSDPRGNDTIVKDQVFDNYLAYDDGTAEKSYYLNLFPTLPGKIAIEYHLNQPDTIRGLSIYFGRQVPFATYKYFSIYIYSQLQGVNGGLNDVVVGSQDFYTAEYFDSINHFWVYTLDTPVVLPAGTFYAGIVQPAESGSDSLYVGLDVNRQGGNHAYYNVFSTWSPSLISGALMIRPLLGHYVSGTSVRPMVQLAPSWNVIPNPATSDITVQYAGNRTFEYIICDAKGRSIGTGIAAAGEHIDVSYLTPGVYYLTVQGADLRQTKEFIKI